MRMHRLTALAATLLLAACTDPDVINWRGAPKDPEVRAFVFNRCAANIRGPSSTHYNDWDEALEVCQSEAAIVSIYCPDKARCNPNLSSRADVRAILPKGDQK